jgi:hypothetical protein
MERGSRREPFGAGGLEAAKTDFNFDAYSDDLKSNLTGASPREKGVGLAHIGYHIPWPGGGEGCQGPPGPKIIIATPSAASTASLIAGFIDPIHVYLD